MVRKLDGFRPKLSNVKQYIIFMYKYKNMYVYVHKWIYNKEKVSFVFKSEGYRNFLKSLIPGGRNI